MPIQSLPSEIVTAIIEWIPSKKDQSSISLTSTYLRSLARPFLFSSVRFPRVFRPAYPRRRNLAQDSEPSARKENHDTRNYTDFVSFLTSAPQVAFFIHSLTLWGNPREGGRWVVPMEVEILNDILSLLPSLKTLCLHKVLFSKSKVPVPHPSQHHSIDRLKLSHAPEPWAVMTPLTLFSHIDELELEPANAWDLTGSLPSFELALQEWDVSKILPIHLQASSVHMTSPFSEPFFEMFRRTRTPHKLRSFSIHSDNITNDCYPSSSFFDLLRESASTLTHITLGTGYPMRSNDQSAYHAFDSDEMCTRLAPLTSLLSLTLKVHPAAWDAWGISNDSLTCHESFGRMIPILSAFPSCLRHITFSFAPPGRPKPGVHRQGDITTASWLDPRLRLRPLGPLLKRYDQLETVVFEGDVELKAEEKERILNDLPEFRKLIQFVDGFGYMSAIDVTKFNTSL